MKMSSKAKAAREDWTGLTFANNWIIQKKLNCAEYRAIYKETTGEDKIIKNTHYLCYNQDCGVSTYLERTLIQRAMNSKVSMLSKCKGCTNGCKKGECHYSTAVREKNLTKTPDRSAKVAVGETYGTFLVKSISPSGNSTNHQLAVEIECVLCGKTKIASANSTATCSVACDCFRNHSTGETLIKKYLDEHNYDYNAEFTFENLYGVGGGSLRYDFAVFDGVRLITLIEFDGEQHFQEAGSYYNQTGRVQIHDDIKNTFAAENNLSLLRIPYTECYRIKEILDDWFKLHN